MIFFDLSAPDIDEEVQIIQGIGGVGRMFMVRSNGQAACLKFLLDSQSVSQVYFKDVEVSRQPYALPGQATSCVLAKFAGFRKPRMSDPVTESVPSLMRRVYEAQQGVSDRSGHDLRRLSIHTPNLHKAAAKSQKLAACRKYGLLHFSAQGTLSSHVTGTRLPDTTLPLIRYVLQDGYDVLEHLI